MLTDVFSLNGKPYKNRAYSSKTSGQCTYCNHVCPFLIKSFSYNFTQNFKKILFTYLNNVAKTGVFKGRVPFC